MTVFARLLEEALGARQAARTVTGKAGHSDALHYWRGYRDCLEAVTGLDEAQIDAMFDDLEANERE